MYNKSVEDLSYVWEAMNLRFGSQLHTSMLNKTTLDGFREHLRQKVAADSTKAVKKPDVSKKRSIPLLLGGLMKSGGGSSPFLGAPRVKTEPASSLFPFGAGGERKSVTVGSRSNINFSLEDPSSSNRACECSVI